MVYKPFSPNSVATLAVLTVAIKAGWSFEVVSCVRSIFGETYSTNVPFCVKDVRLHFDCTGSHKPSVAENSRAILSSLCARQIVLIVAGCEFLDRSRSPLGTLAVSGRSRCGAVLILIIKEEVFYRKLAQGS